MRKIKTIKDAGGNEYTTEISGSSGNTITTSTLSNSNTGDIIITNGTSWTGTDIIFGDTEPMKEKCSKCKKDEVIEKRYNWSDDNKLERRICKKCNTKAMDKFYDLDNNIPAEETLYGKK